MQMRNRHLKLLSKISKFYLILLVLFGLILRISGIMHDLPYHYYGDESTLIEKSLSLGIKNLDPQWFLWPTFFLYILFFLFCVFFCIGYFFGFFKNILDFAYLYFYNPSSFFIIGRIVSVFFGTLSILIVYLIGRKCFGKKVGLLAATIFTFLPLSIENSHYAIVDSTYVFMILLAFVFILDILLYSRLKDYLLSGLFTGLAIATKYPAMMLVLPLFLSFLFNKMDFSKIKFKIILLFVFIFLGFFIGCPFSFINFKIFMKDFYRLSLPMQFGWSGWERGVNIIQALKNNFIYGIGLLLLIISIISILYLMMKRKRVYIIFISFPLLYFIMLLWTKHAPEPRYILPILPFLAISSAKLLFDFDIFVKNRLKIRQISIVIISIICVLNIYKTSFIILDFYSKDTRTIASEWIERNIPPGSKILLNPYSPTLRQESSENTLSAFSKYQGKFDIIQLKEKIAKSNNMGISYKLSYIIEPTRYLEGDKFYDFEVKESMSKISKIKEYNFIIISDGLLSKFYNYSYSEIPPRYWFLKNFYEKFRNLKPTKSFFSTKRYIYSPSIRVYRLNS